MRYTAVLWFFIILGILATASLARAGDDGSDTLAGLPSVYLDIVTWPAADASEKLLLNDVKVMLQTAGIGVLTPSESMDLGEAADALLKGAMLMVQVTGFGSNLDQAAAFSVRVDLRQGVYLSRDPTHSALAITWSTDSVRFGNFNDARDTVKEAVHYFTTAWSLKNPKK